MNPKNTLRKKLYVGLMIAESIAAAYLMLGCANEQLAVEKVQTVTEITKNTETIEKKLKEVEERNNNKKSAGILLFGHVTYLGMLLTNPYERKF